MPEIKQVGNALTNLVIIFVTAIALGIVNANMHGELHTLDMLVHVIEDSIIPAVTMCAGWILLKSPFAPTKFTATDMQQAAKTGQVPIPPEK